MTGLAGSVKDLGSSGEQWEVLKGSETGMRTVGSSYPGGEARSEASFEGLFKHTSILPSSGSSSLGAGRAGFEENCGLHYKETAMLMRN